MSGSEGCGKSQLLAWLVRHGRQSGAPAARAVHAVVPFAGQSLRGTVWSIADQLGVVARAPGELAVALSRDPRRTVIVLPDLHDEDVTGLALDLVRLPHVRLIAESRSGSPAHRVLSHAECAELDLDLAQWRDQRRFEQWRAAQPDDRATASPATVETPLDLSDPAAVCEADPWEVTSAYDRADDQDHGGLRAAWRRAGQSLCREQPPASRALVLLSLLGDSADPRVAPALREVAASADWGIEWSRVRGDLTPPWPGPVTTLAMGKGPLADCLVAVGPDGTVKAVRMADAGARGRLPHNRLRPVAVDVMTDGTVLMLDEHGRLEAQSGWAARPAGAGLAGLLDEGPTGAQRLLDSMEGHTGTALAHAAGGDLGFVALGDAIGTVRIFGDVADSAQLHEGRVNALAAISVPLDDVAVPLVYSGGADGTVRAWSPGRAPMTAPVLQQPFPVVSMDATFTRNGPATVVAWGDGTVECVHWDMGVQQTFRPGPPVRAVAVDADSRVLVGMDEALICLVPKAVTGDGGVA
ncbi:hypothetical protein ABZX98_32750 [Streptomyces sp. NPDC002992]|uniref:hypothetical protein n=1 Tax=Streptomyces sp. NPDC002992 TaxID=3154273 RepID=UPI0033ABC9A6